MKKYLPLIGVVLAIVLVISYNNSQINSNQHYVDSNGGYWRTNPNNTVEDNIGTNNLDTLLGVTTILLVSILLLPILLTYTGKKNSIQVPNTKKQEDTSIDDLAFTINEIPLPVDNDSKNTPQQSTKRNSKSSDILTEHKRQIKHLLSNDDLQGAIDVYSKIVSLDPNNHDSYYQRALLIIEMGCSFGVDSIINNPEQLAPPFVTSDFNLQIEFSDALNDLSKAVSLAPLNVSYFMLRGRLNLALATWSYHNLFEYNSYLIGALSDFDTVLRMDVNNPDAMKYKQRSMHMLSYLEE